MAAILFLSPMLHTSQGVTQKLQMVNDTHIIEQSSEDSLINDL